MGRFGLDVCYAELSVLQHLSDVLQILKFERRRLVRLQL